MGALFVIRHGQASYGQADYDKLSPRGIEQARAVGAFLATQPALDHVFVGPHVRQQQTYAHARAAHPALPEPTTLLELAEYPAFAMIQHFGPRLPVDDPELAALDPARRRDRAFDTILSGWAADRWQSPDVEPIAAFVARVRAAIERAIATVDGKPGSRVALVTSAGPIGVAVGLAYDLAAPRMVRTSVVVRNASITELRFRSQGFTWQPDQLSLVTFNTTGHLPADLHTER